MSVETDLAYAAGIIDGEGCIGLYEKAGKHISSFRPSLVIAMNDVQVMQWFHRTYGGRLTEHIRKDTKAEDGYRWCLDVRPPLVLLLTSLLPYLKTKHLQASIVIDFCKRFPTSSWHWGLSRAEALAKMEEMQAYVEMMHKLNSKGRGSNLTKSNARDILSLVKSA